MTTTRHLSRFALAPVFIGVACLASPALAQPVFQCEQLELPAGNTPGSWPMAINRSGAVVGAFGMYGIGDYTPGKWGKTGQKRPLAYEDGATGFHLGGINDDGYATGYNTAWTGPNHDQLPSGYIWSPDGTASRLTQYQNQNTAGNSINNAGVVAGRTSLSSTPLLYKATLWEDGAQKYLPPLQAGMAAEALQINDKDVVVGWSRLTVDGEQTTHAVKWVNRKAKDLGTLPGHRASAAQALNTAGVIVGYSVGVTRQPVAWVNGVIQPLTADQSAGEALSVNRRGEIVGNTTTRGATYWPQAGAEPVALDSVIAADHPCRSAEGAVISLREATAINAGGVIVGYGDATTPSGNHYLAGFKLVPVPAQ
ncbi:hypothetical protein [Ideonella sp.]|uniref:hypothetical protein n=1 Tax=Ideonella sp. TaxID=1929293 RepID=UPI0035B08A0F